MTTSVKSRLGLIMPAISLLVLLGFASNARAQFAQQILARGYVFASVFSRRGELVRFIDLVIHATTEQSRNKWLTATRADRKFVAV